MAAAMAEVLVLRHQNAVLRRQITRVRYEPADRTWFAALSALVPRARWAEVFPVTPATLQTNPSPRSSISTPHASDEKPSSPASPPNIT
jgi:putative transposase